MEEQKEKESEKTFSEETVEEEKEKAEKTKWFGYESTPECFIRIGFGSLVLGLVAFGLLYTKKWEESANVMTYLSLGLGVICAVGAYLPIRMNKIVSAIFFAIAPVLTFGAMECMTHEVWKMAISPIILNLIFFYCLYLLATALLGRTKFGAGLAGIFAMFVGCVNYFAVLCRDVPVLPWDVKSAGVALSVSDNYKLTFESRQCLCCFIILFFIVIGSYSTIRLRRLLTRGIVLGASAALILTMNFLLHQVWFTDNFTTFGNLFTQIYTYRDNGFAVSFMMNLQYLNIDKPSGYSAKKVDEILENAVKTFDESHSSDAGTETAPNIIMIMDEAFTDLAYVNDFTARDLKGNEVDYMPFIHSLQEQEDVISGNLYVSVCGGNTANTEFEVMTGNSMAFLPAGSVAFQQYLDSEMSSFASVIGDQGYYSSFLHPYNAGGWQRNKVYPMLGFDELYFNSSFKGAKKLRKYVSDESAFDKIISLYKSEEIIGDGESQFFFEVTMQNHGGYSDIYENCPIEIQIDGVEREATNNYLTLVRKTDTALKKLVDYYSQIEEPTMVVFFGDHQPSDFVANPLIYAMDTTFEEMSFEEQQTRHVVPFVIWANYDMDVDQYKYEMLSANYLGPVILDAAGLQMSPFQKYLFQLKEEYPVICAYSYAENDHVLHPYGDNLPDKINEYKILQYNYMFDDKKRDESNYSIEVSQ